MTDRFCKHFDPFDPELNERFFEVLRELREKCPVAHTDAHGGFYVVTRYADVWRVLRDPETFSSAQGVAVPRNDSAPLMPPIETDPPTQREYRRLLNPFLTPEGVAVYETGIRRIVTEHIDEFIERGRCDLATDFAQPVPGTIFFELVLGVAPEELPQVKAWSHTITYDARSEAGTRALAEFPVWILAWLRRRLEASPRGDLVDALLRAEIEGQQLTPEAIVPTMIVLIMGGLDTTSNAIGNVMRHLAERPELRRALRDDLSRLPRMLDEFLRFEAPAVALGRTVTRDVDLGGRELRRGDKVLLYFASANRDAAEFDRADELVFDRPRNRHLSFGGGPHRCIGSNLARLQLRVALEELIVRLSEFRIPDGARVEYMTAFSRGPISLPLEFPPGPRLSLA